jgi:predicted metal-binding membrane protein
MSMATLTETLVRRDRTVVLSGLGAIVLLSWLYMGYLAWDMAGMMEVGDAGMNMGTGVEMGDTGMEMAMPSIQPWGAVDYLLMFIMWTVMMVAMMTPSAAPMVLTYTKFSRGRRAARGPARGTAHFFRGDNLVW